MIIGSDPLENQYSIGQVSVRVNLSQKTLRDYEKVGLIKPIRAPRTNNRIYTDFEIAQIKHISRLIHQEGFTLSCIQRMLQLAPCWKIFDCQAKSGCPAFASPSTPCYEIRENQPTRCSGPCEQCALYLNRSSEAEMLLLGPNHAHI